MTTAVHLRVANLSTPRGRSKAEHTLARLRGVIDVSAVASMHLISVLFDDAVTSVGQVTRALRRAGFEVRPSR